MCQIYKLFHYLVDQTNEHIVCPAPDKEIYCIHILWQFTNLDIRIKCKWETLMSNIHFIFQNLLKFHFTFWWLVWNEIWKTTLQKNACKIEIEVLAFPFLWMFPQKDASTNRNFFFKNCILFFEFLNNHTKKFLVRNTNLLNGHSFIIDSFFFLFIHQWQERQNQI